MSIEEDVEIRDLLTQTLESNGSLAKIRAQLRACVFLALDEDELLQKKAPLINHKIKKSIQTTEGKLMFCIIREFLEYYNLDNTIVVYEPESYLGTEYNYEGRNKLIEDLKLDCNDSVPLLLQLIKIAQKKTYETINNAQNINIKVDTSDVDKISINGFIDLPENKIPKLDLKNNTKENIFNETFDLSSPTIEQSDDKVDTPRSTESANSKDGTYEGTSSIAEDSIKDKPLIDFDKSIRSSDSLHSHMDTPKTLLDSTIKDSDFSPPILKETKISPLKQDKLKTKSCMTSLADLPSLPSLLYKDKEFKDKTNLKEIDKFYMDMDNYEEDFMSGSNLDASNDKSLLVPCKSPKELKNCDNLHKIFKDDKIKKHTSNETVDENSSCRERIDSAASSVTSEDFDLSSNVDDILKSSSN